ncbi:MAG TPA: hypothetical protein VIB39_01975 [Candidatus Angelobacter sp.]|jgi:hypothetical protein
MSNDNENRVLSRKGARRLTKDEIEKIAASGDGFTRASHTLTGPISNPDTGFDS